MDSDQDSSLQLEFLDIEIINHKKEQDAPKKWKCNQCSLFYLSEDKLAEHKKKHSSVPEEVINCRYCGKALSSNDSKECVANKKCETCEYRCQNCPQRFLRYSSLVNHEQNHSCGKKKRSIGIRKSVDDAPPAPPTVKRIKTLLPRKRKSESDPVKETKIVSNDSPKKKLKASNGIGKVSNNEKVLQNSSKSPKKKLPVNPTTDKVTAKQTTSANTNASSSVTDNSVNYKPFSCHVCGDNFASDNILLQHIKTHGDAANSFKCKYCGNEFENIYDMQYHLAICPLAEDEIDAAMKVSEAEVSKVTPKKSVEPVEKVANKRRSRKSLVDQNKDLNNSTVKEAKSEKSEPDETFSKPASPAKRKSMLRKPKEKSPAPPIVVDCAEVTLPEDEDNDFSLEYSEDPLGGEESLDANDTGGNTDQTQKEDDNKKLHICPFPRCSFKFTREKALLCHMRNHGDDFDDTLKCHRCDIPFDDLKSLRLHIDECKGIKEEEDDDFQRKSVNKQKRSPEKPNASTFQGSSKGWLCKVCDRVYPSKEKLARCCHGKLQEAFFECRMCPKKFETEAELQTHFSSHHRGNLPFQCITCFSEFRSEDQESTHTCSVVKTDYECIICARRFTSYNQLYTHYNKDHLKENDCICKTCNRLFPDAETLREHLVSHSVIKRITCVFCQKSYSCFQTLNYHLAHQHDNHRAIKCPLCYRPFFDSNSLTKHMLFHASLVPNKNSFKCCFCAAPFTQRIGLLNHLERNHKTEKCPICKSTCSDKSVVKHLFDHSIRIHRGTMSKDELKWMKTNQNKDKSNIVDHSVADEIKIETSSTRRSRRHSSIPQSILKSNDEINGDKSVSNSSEPLSKEDSKQSVSLSNTSPARNRSRMPLDCSNSTSVQKISNAQTTSPKKNTKAKISLTKELEPLNIKRTNKSKEAPVVEIRNLNEMTKFDIKPEQEPKFVINSLNDKVNMNNITPENQGTCDIMSINEKAELKIINKSLRVSKRTPKPRVIEDMTSNFPSKKIKEGNEIEEEEKYQDESILLNEENNQKLMRPTKKESAEVKTLNNTRTSRQEKLTKLDQFVNQEQAVKTKSNEQVGKLQNEIESEVEAKSPESKERPMSFIFVSTNSKSLTKKHGQNLLKMRRAGPAIVGNCQKSSIVKAKSPNENKSFENIYILPNGLDEPDDADEDQFSDKLAQTHLKNRSCDFDFTKDHQQYFVTGLTESLTNNKTEEGPNLNKTGLTEAEISNLLVEERDDEDNKEDLGGCLNQLQQTDDLDSSQRSKDKTFHFEKLKKKEKKTQSDKSSQFIQQKKCFVPTLSLTPYSCTTCLLSFSSENDLLLHNAQHIF